MGTTFDDKNVIGLFMAGYEAAFSNSWAKTLSLFNGNSTRGTETYGILGSNPAMREWIGGRLAQVYNKKTYDIRNRAYEGTIEIAERDLTRDATGMLQARLNTFAADAGAEHWESLLVDLMNSGTSGYAYDGVVFYSASHTWGDSGTQKNLITATEVPSANVGTATAPTPAEAANVLMETIGYMMTLKNDKGRPINGSARNFVVQVATAPLFSAFSQAWNNPVLAATVSNPTLGLKQAGFNITTILTPTLTSSTAVVRVHRVDGPVKPFIIQEEQALQVDLLGRGSDYYFDNKAIKLGVDASRGAGYGEPLYSMHLTLS